MDLFVSMSEQHPLCQRRGKDYVSEDGLDRCGLHAWEIDSLPVDIILLLHHYIILLSCPTICFLLGLHSESAYLYTSHRTSLDACSV